MTTSIRILHAESQFLEIWTEIFLNYHHFSHPLQTAHKYLHQNSHFYLKNQLKEAATITKMKKKYQPQKPQTSNKKTPAIRNIIRQTQKKTKEI